MRVSPNRLDRRELAADFVAARSFETVSTGPEPLGPDCPSPPSSVPSSTNRGRNDPPAAGGRTCRELVRNRQKVVTRSSADNRTTQVRRPVQDSLVPRAHASSNSRPNCSIPHL